MPVSARIPREAAVGDPFLGAIIPALGSLAVSYLKKRGQARAATMIRTPIQGVVGGAAALGGGIGRGMGHRALPPIPAAPRSTMVRGMLSARGRVIGVGRRRRRMNTLNLRALKRALRRVKGFEKIARKVVRAPRHFRTRFPARKRGR